MMFVSKIYSSDLEDRFDSKFYNPEILQLLARARSKANLSIEKLGSLSTRVKKGIFYIRAFEYRKKGVPFVRVKDVKNLALKADDLTFISKERSRQEQRTCMDVGDILITKGGTVGVVTYVPSWVGKCNISQDVIGVSIKQEFDPWYIVAFLSSKFGRLQFQRVKTQQAQPHLTLEYVRKAKVFLPEKSLQSKISKLIQEVDAKERKALELIGHAKKILCENIGVDIKEIQEEKSYMINSGELGNTFIPNFYYPLFVKTIRAMERKLHTIRLGEISDIEKGNEVGSRNYIPFIDKGDDDIPFIRTSDIGNFEIDNNPDFFVSNRVYHETSQDIEEQDILFTNDGKIGYSAMVVKGDQCVIQSHIRRVRVLEKLSPCYVFAFLNTPFAIYQVYQRICIQATISTIGRGLKSITIPLLDNAIQDRISSIVGEAFRLKQEKKELLREARRLVRKILD